MSSDQFEQYLKRGRRALDERFTRVGTAAVEAAQFAPDQHSNQADGHRTWRPDLNSVNPCQIVVSSN